MLIHVYASRVEEVRKRLDKLGKKAQRYGVEFKYEMLPEVKKEVAVYDYDAVGHCKYLVTTYSVLAVPIQISDEPVCSTGWKAVAQIEHFPEGNVVTMFDRGADAPDAWKTCASYCDHCGTKRDRRVTYMVLHESGETRQVGSKCLKEYTGIDPNACAIWAQVTDCEDDFQCDPSYVSCFREIRSYDVIDVLALAVDAVKKWGYVRSDDRNATRDRVAEAFDKNETPSNEAKQKAAVVLEWLKGLAVTGGTGCEYDVAPIAKQGFCAARHFGRICYCPVAYDRAMERMAREKAREAEKTAQRASSGFVGEIGQKVSFKAATAVLVTSWENQFGTTFLYKMTDETGNVFVWYSSGSREELVGGATVKGTVKDHKEYDGVKQTVLTRCRVA